MGWLDEIRWDRDGLVPAIAQERASGDVLMVAWMNREALALTAERGEAVFWSRSRRALWHKGESSGHRLRVEALRLDCDGDVLLLDVHEAGRDGPAVACHTGRHSCFFRRLDAGEWRTAEDTAAPRIPAPDGVLERLAAVIASRRGADAGTSYVARLFDKGTDAILKKVGEEATELVMAAKDGAPAAIVAEAADLWFHVLVTLAQFGLGPAQVLAELARREGLSGLEEFAARPTPHAARPAAVGPRAIAHPTGSEPP